MKKALTVQILLSVILLALSATVLGKRSVSLIASRYASSVVSITALDEDGKPLSKGSGFFVDTEGSVVTNHHVLAGSVEARVRTSDGRQGRVLEITRDDPLLDLVVVRTSLRKTIPLILGDSDAIRIGDEIIIMGNPAVLKDSVSLGTVRDVLKAEGITLIQSTAPILPGSSGGPMMNPEGKVIGVATAFLDLGQNVSFAMPANYLKTLTGVRLDLRSLPRTTIKLEAIIGDRVSIETLDVLYQDRMDTRKRKNYNSRIPAQR